MFSQYPSSRPVEFPDTIAGYLDMLEHDHGWAVGSGYVEDDVPFDREDETQDVARDGNGNLVRLGAIYNTKDGKSYQVVHLIENGRLYNSGRGYIVDATDPEGHFGDDDCPSSYKRPTLSWFGPGERYISAHEALMSAMNS